MRRMPSPTGPQRLIRLLRRGLRKPPGVIARRVVYEAQVQAERYVAPWRARRFDARRAAARVRRAHDLDSLWRRLAARPYPAHTARSTRPSTGACARATRSASARPPRTPSPTACGCSGPRRWSSGPRIDWLRDFRSGVAWPRALHARHRLREPARRERRQGAVGALAAAVADARRPGLPARRGDERYAEAVRAVLESWIDANPYARTVNWSCTMEAALRILSWTWFFRVFHASRAWADPGFRERFLCALYLHGDFTERHLEHLGRERQPLHGGRGRARLRRPLLRRRARTRSAGWRGAGRSCARSSRGRSTRTASTSRPRSPYHRLVAELFLLPALYREALGLDVPEPYRERLVAMARFTAAYSRPDGSVPLWGDADDARALPLGGQDAQRPPLPPGLVGAAWDVAGAAGGLRRASRARRSGCSARAAAESLPRWPRRRRARRVAAPSPTAASSSCATPSTTCSSTAAGSASPTAAATATTTASRSRPSLDGVRLVSDCGAFVYTRSFEERNRFRSTAYHNTPQRRRRGDQPVPARPAVGPRVRRPARRAPLRDGPGGATSSAGRTRATQRLPAPVTPVRTIVLDHRDPRAHDHGRLRGLGPPPDRGPAAPRPGRHRVRGQRGPPGPAQREAGSSGSTGSRPGPGLSRSARDASRPPTGSR